MARLIHEQYFNSFSRQGVWLFGGCRDLGNILFVSANEEKEIS